MLGLVLNCLIFELLLKHAIGRCLQKSFETKSFSRNVKLNANESPLLTQKEAKSPPSVNF